VFKNKTIVESERKTRIRDEVDILVVGGGPSGTLTAIAAARHGAKVCLIERFGFLGGMCTQTPLCTWPVNTAVEYGQKDVEYGGIPEEIISRLKKTLSIELRRNVWEGQEANDSSSPKTKTTQNWYLYDPEELIHVLFDMIKESKIKLLLHTLFVEAIVEETVIKGVIVESKAGREAILANVIIDATADGDVAASAGAHYEIGCPYTGLTMPPESSWIVAGVDTDDVDPSEINRVYEKARKEGKIHIMREAILTNRPFLTKGVVKFFGTRIIGVDMLDPASLTYGEIETRRQIKQIMNLLRENFSAFSQARVVRAQNVVCNRGVRRITGMHVLTKEDILEARKYPNAIATSTARIEIHDPITEKILFWQIPPGEWYDFPYGCLVPIKIDSLLTTGGCISATMVASGAVNTTPNAMLLGQAAGTAAALALETDVLPRDVSITKLQEYLKQDGVFLG
jgi:hypothetical protein